MIFVPHKPSDGRRSTWPPIIVANVIVIVIVIALIVWFAGGKRHFIPRHWAVVDAGVVYRSGELSPSLVETTWEKNGIKSVVNLMGPQGDDPDAERAAAHAAHKLGVNRQFFPLIGDGTGDVEQYVGAIKAIVDARSQHRPVVVHCATGTYRTGGVVAAYRTLVEGWTGKAAYDEMIAEGVRPGPDTPLMVYLNKNIATIAQRLVEEGVIEKAPDPLPHFGP